MTHNGDLQSMLDELWRALAVAGALDDAASRAPAQRDGAVLRIRVAGREAVVDPAAQRAGWAEGGDLGAGLLPLLRYLLGAKDMFPRGQQAPFRKLPGAAAVADSFRGRVIEPLTSTFSAAPDKLLNAGLLLGGRETPNMGDCAVEVTVFPRIPVTFVVWAATPAMPAAANVFFDTTAVSHIEIDMLALATEWTLSLLKS